MADKKLVCRVCGKQYSACRNLNRHDGIFRWQIVACSPECGAIYLAQVNRARNKGVDEEYAAPELENDPLDEAAK